MILKHKMLFSWLARRTSLPGKLPDRGKNRAVHRKSLALHLAQRIDSSIRSTLDTFFARKS
jgi:hypothetical protein